MFTKVIFRKRRGGIKTDNSRFVVLFTCLNFYRYYRVIHYLYYYIVSFLYPIFKFIIVNKPYPKMAYY